jgi:plastocyanin
MGLGKTAKAAVLAVPLAWFMGCGGGGTGPSDTGGGGGGTGGGGTGGGGGGGGGASTTATITIGANNAVSPQTVTIVQGGRVTFVNNDSRPHDMASDPHPSHEDCPPMEQVGFLSPGQSRASGNFNTVRACGFHDHNQPSVTGLTGQIIIVPQ